MPGEEDEGNEEGQKGAKTQIAAREAMAEVEAEGQEDEHRVDAHEQAEAEGGPGQATEEPALRVVEAGEGQEGEEEEELRDRLRDRGAGEPHLHHVRGEEERAEERGRVAQEA